MKKYIIFCLWFIVGSGVAAERDSNITLKFSVALNTQLMAGLNKPLYDPGDVFPTYIDFGRDGVTTFWIQDLNIKSDVCSKGFIQKWKKQKTLALLVFDKPISRKVKLHIPGPCIKSEGIKQDAFMMLRVSYKMGIKEKTYYNDIKVFYRIIPNDKLY